MKKLLLALILISSPIEAAWTRVGTFAVGNDTTANTSLVKATSATLEAGNVGICVVAADDGFTGTADGDRGNVTNFQDAAGNTWNKAIEYCNAQATAAQNGACVDIYWTKATTQLNSGSNITVTFVGSVVKAITCDEFTITNSTYVVTKAAGSNGAPYDAADPGSLTDATGANHEHLFVRGDACESNVTTYTPTAAYTGFGGSTTTSTANTGTLLTSMGARGESKIETASTSTASDPTYTAADCASAIMGLDEDAPPTCTAGLNLTLLGVGGCP